MTGDDLPHRVPQQSEGARLDRTLSWTGRLVPLPQPCTDLELMARTLHGLQKLSVGDTRPSR